MSRKSSIEKHKRIVANLPDEKRFSIIAYKFKHFSYVVEFILVKQMVIALDLIKVI